LELLCAAAATAAAAIVHTHG
jgi:hypothetical protein